MAFIPYCPCQPSYRPNVISEDWSVPLCLLEPVQDCWRLWKCALCSSSSPLELQGVSWSNHSVHRHSEESAGRGNMRGVLESWGPLTVLWEDLLSPPHGQPDQLGLHIELVRALEPAHQLANSPELQGNSNHPLSIRLMEQRTTEGAANPRHYLILTNRGENVGGSWSVVTFFRSMLTVTCRPQSSSE